MLFSYTKANVFAVVNAVNANGSCNSCNRKKSFDTLLRQPGKLVRKLFRFSLLNLS